MKYYCDHSRHLICIPYTIDNLHLMADDLGINRCWFHNSKYPHYDIALTTLERPPSSMVIVGMLLTIAKILF